MEFLDTPLKDCIAYLSHLSKVPIHLDLGSLADDGINDEEAITLNLEKCSVESVLNLMLSPVGCSWFIKDEVVTITSLTTDQEELFTKSYDVSQILKSLNNKTVSQRRKKQARQDYIQPSSSIPDLTKTAVGTVSGTPSPYSPEAMQLVDLLQQCTNAEWFDTDGAGGIISSPMNGVLTISQTFHAHQEIEGLLRALKAMISGQHHMVTAYRLGYPLEKEEQLRKKVVPADRKSNFWIHA